MQPNAEKIVGPDHLLLADGQKQGIAQVVLLPAALHGLEQGKAQEKAVHGDWIARNHGQIAQGQGGEGKFLFQKLLHRVMSSFSSRTMMSSRESQSG